MTDNEIIREKTFSEELPYFKEQIKEVFDYYDNPKGCAEMLYIAVLSDSNRIVRKAEEEITRQQAEIERLQHELNIWKDIAYRETSYVSIAKTEAVKEFAERLKELYTDESITDDMHCFIGVIKQNIDDISEEMITRKD